MAVLEGVVIFLGHHCCHLAGVYQLVLKHALGRGRTVGWYSCQFVYVKERRKEETFP